MNRLQKKCFIASAGVHLFLVLLLLLGPGFISSKNKAADDLPILDFVPFKTVDALVSGGGNPKASLPPAAPAPRPLPPPLPAVTQPPPEKNHEPDPPKELARQVKPPKLEEESLEPNKKKIEISTKLVSRNQEDKTDAKARAEEKAREDAKRAADVRRRMARQIIGQAAENISSEVSGGTTIELRGPGGGGVPYANFLQAVKSVYANAWVVPDGVADDQATTAASVTIARDGTVVSSHIVRRSGDSAVDQSVQATLDRVRYAAPLPEDAKESQRTVTINFNVRAKRLLG